MIYLDNQDNLDQTYNFAMEEYALRYLDENETYFMFYRMHPTVIVGKNQNTLQEINQAYVHENNLPVLRRLSGGGAVYNDEGNISFSMITKDDGDSFQNFARFTEPVIEALRSLGVDAKLSGRNDIEVGGKKISGNAQFVTKGRLYTHGTLMFDVNLENLTKALHVDPEKYLSKGVQSVRARVTTIKEHLQEDMDILQFKQLLLESIFKTKDIPTYQFTEEDKTKIAAIQKERYQNWDWNFGKSPKGSVIKKKRFPAGTVEFHLEIKKGYLESITIYGDFFAVGDITEIQALLEGTKYTREAVQEKLDAISVSHYFGKISEAELLNLLF